MRRQARRIESLRTESLVSDDKFFAMFGRLVGESAAFFRQTFAGLAQRYRLIAPGAAPCLKQECQKQ